VGQIPAYYYHKPSARRGYLFTDASPLFPFGHGLSYTTFSYNDLRVDQASIHPDETRIVSFTIGREQLQYLDEDMQMTVEPGEFKLMVGGSSETVQHISLEVVRA